MRPDGVLEMRENYVPNEVQMLRDLQVQQALNPKIDNGGTGSHGIGTPLDVLSSNVPVEWVTQDGRSRGPAAPITGAAGSERSMAMRRDNWEDGQGLHRGNAISDYVERSRLQNFIDESGGNPAVLFPSQTELRQPQRTPAYEESMRW